MANRRLHSNLPGDLLGMDRRASMGEARQRRLAKAAGRPWPQDAPLPFQGIDRSDVDQPSFSNVISSSPVDGMSYRQLMDRIADIMRSVEASPVLVIRDPIPRFMPMPEIVQTIIDDPLAHFSVTGRPPGRPRGK